MARNVILVISTLAVLLLLFVGYLSLVGGPPPRSDETLDAEVALPSAAPVSDERKLALGPIDIEPGEEMAYVRYGPDGQPTDYFRLETWEKIPDSQNEVLVKRPELMMRLAGGVVVTVTAERGQIRADLPRGQRLRPRYGWLEGNARIVVEQAAAPADGTPATRPAGQIVIEMERLHFDLELGELKTGEPLFVRGPGFEITGTGLHLIWNQAANRVEKLLISSGGRMVLESELLGGVELSGSARGAQQQPASAAAPPGTPAADARGRRRPPTAYRCVLSGGVTVEHEVGGEPVGGLRADELTLLFDLDSAERQLGRQPAGPRTTPTPGSQPVRRLIVEWHGQLAMHPTPPADGPPRRRVEARGTPLLVELPNGFVRCGRLVLHQETRRLWLYPAQDGVVELSNERGLSVRGNSLYADLRENTVKLLGDVRFHSAAAEKRAAAVGSLQAAPGPDEELAIACDLWAELRLAGTAAEPSSDEQLFDVGLASRPPERATFVGNVSVHYGAQRVQAHRLDARFRRPPESPPQMRPAGPSERLPTLLEAVVAEGEVRLVASEPVAERRSSDLKVLADEFAVLRQALARALSPTVAAGGERQQPDRALQCAWLRLGFAAAKGGMTVRELEAVGAVRIRDRDSRFAARGRRVLASFKTNGELERATVEGSAADDALVRARAYALRGQRIDVDNVTRTLHVPGRSRLAFLTQRSLRGELRGTPETITITSHAALHIDDPRNTVEFHGQVVASTGHEKLLAERLTLLLEDVPEARAGGFWERLRSLGRLLRGPRAAEGRPLLAATRSARGMHKELARIYAYHAVLQSERYAPGEELPLVHQSITAPELECDVRRRWIRTRGETTLLMTDRRPAAADDTRAAPLGLPSALMTRGPSQTAMRCSRSLLYVLGPEGPERTDSVLLEGAVRFRHVAGRQMARLREMLPEVARDPERLARLTDRNIYLECGRLEGLFAVGGAGSGGPLPRSLQPVWLNARENVYLRDQQEANIRSVYARQLQYDRTDGVIRVLGGSGPEALARVYDENRQTGRFSIPAVSPEIVIDLTTNTIRARQIRGQATAR